jgi:hypothetical protein
MTNKRNKLKKVNVPEMFYLQFLSNIPTGTSSVIDRLHAISPTPRGRGLTRVLPEVTNEEWNDLYKQAAMGRKAIRGADRSTELRPAICAGAMADRMEKLGVDNVIPYDIPKVEVNIPDVDTAEATSDLPSTPIELETADDLDEVDDKETQAFREDISNIKW